MSGQGAKEREVLQLLKDLRAFKSPFGGAISIDDAANMRDASYGPAGLIFAGVEFKRSDRLLLRESFGALRRALILLRLDKRTIAKYENGDEITGISAWSALLEPYLSDPADPSIVDDWRRKAQAGYISARRFVERHDAAVERLAEYLRNEDLHVVFSKTMSENEEAKIEHQYAEMYAVFQRLRVSGLSVPIAMAQAAENFGVPVDVIERVVEFRSENKPNECVWSWCERTPFSQNLCVAHYQKKRREEKKRGNSDTKVAQ